MCSSDLRLVSDTIASLKGLNSEKLHQGVILAIQLLCTENPSLQNQLSPLYQHIISEEKVLSDPNVNLKEKSKWGMKQYLSLIS